MTGRESLQTLEDNKVFEGRQLRLGHASRVLACDMTFSVFLPCQALAAPDARFPVVYWLSGLTCTDQNFVQKAGAQRAASELGLILVAPDTSPRGEGVPDDPDGAYDFGLGAGFYVNATQPPFASHYRMYDYVCDELPALVEQQFPVDSNRQGISGHSMGGHGALTIALRNPQRFRSVTAFAPICSPMNCPWGEKALSGYLGDDRAAHAQHDACALLRTAEQKLPMLVDQGSKDQFLEEQLKPELLLEAATAADYPVEYRLRDGYDHSYFFIATFIEEHLQFHAQHLC